MISRGQQLVWCAVAAVSTATAPLWLLPASPPPPAPASCVSHKSSTDSGTFIHRYAVTTPAARQGTAPEPRAYRAGSEAAYLDAFRTLALASRTRLRAELARALAERGALAERVAAARAWHEARLDPPLGGFAELLASDAPELVFHALRFLGRRARQDPGARAVLLAHARTRPADVRVRGQTLHTLLLCSPEHERAACLSLLWTEADGDVVALAVEALRDADAGAAAVLVADLARGHPAESVRARLRAQ